MVAGLWPNQTGTEMFHSRKKDGLGQIVVYRVIVGVDVDSLKRGRFIEIDVLERSEWLNLLVGRQLIPIPAPAERTHEPDRALQQFGLDLHRFDARSQGGDLRINEFEAGGQTPLIEFSGQILCLECGADCGVLPIGGERQLTGQAEIVFDFSKRVEHCGAVSILRLAIG